MIVSLSCMSGCKTHQYSVSENVKRSRGGASRPTDKLAITSKEGEARPRSILLMYSADREVFSASCSCVKSRDLRSNLTRRPKSI